MNQYLYSLVVIGLGAMVLLFGGRLRVLGAAVGGLLGVVLARLIPDASFSVQLAIVLGLALMGWLFVVFIRGFLEVVILVIGALAGAAITLGLLQLFNVDEILVTWVLAVIGGVIGLILIRRSRRGSRDWGMIILADLVGALLIVRGLGLLFPSLRATTWGSLLTLLGLLVFGFIYQGGYLRRGKSAPPPVESGKTKAKPAAPKAEKPKPAESKAEKAAKSVVEDVEAAASGAASTVKETAESVEAKAEKAAESAVKDLEAAASAVEELTEPPAPKSSGES